MLQNISKYLNKYIEYVFIFYFFLLSFFPYSAEILKIFCLICFIFCWILKVRFEKSKIFTKTSINIPIFAFLLCALVAVLCSFDVQYSIHSFLFDYLILFIIFFAIVNTLGSMEQIHRIVNAMLIIFGLVCVYGIYGYYMKIAIRNDRLIATFDYHSPCAKYISYLLPIVIYLLLSCKEYRTRIYLITLVFVGSFSVVLTQNRTSWVAIFITVLFLLVIAKRRYLIIFVLLVCLLMYFVGSSKYSSHARTIFQVSQLSTSKSPLGQRLLCWNTSVEIIKDYPFLGIGIGPRIFRNTYQKYAQEIVNKKNLKIKKIERVSHAHNVFLTIFVEMGILGLISFIWLYVTIFYSAIKLYKTSRDERTRNVIMGIVGSLLCIFLHGATDNFIKKPDVLFLWFIIGILFALIQKQDKSTTTGESRQLAGRG
ncbi:MAG TPA: O-antigen ligase family protein [Candidatus Babeliales bacterium]|nr:O-antigen ligase family protein [Candidatus Babeliales bacterium]